jgi:rhamnulose-1-phosphate aldolase
MHLSHNKRIRRIMEEIAKVSGYLWNKGWAESNAGNISVDVSLCLVPEHALRRRLSAAGRTSKRTIAGHYLLVTAAGARMRDVARFPNHNLLLIRVLGKDNGYEIVSGLSGLRPTSELVSHLAIHACLSRRGFKTNAVIHTHPLNLTALSFIPAFSSEIEVNRILLAMLPEVKITLPEGIGAVTYRCPGTESLARATSRSMRKHRLVIWQKHGVIAAGQSVNEAFDIIDTADTAAGIFLACLRTGHRPAGLTAAQQAELERKFRKQ